MAGDHIFEKFEMLMPVKRFSLRETLSWYVNAHQTIDNFRV